MSTIMQVVDRIRASKLDDKIPCDESFDLQAVDISESLRFVASREARAAVTLKRIMNRKFRSRQSRPMKSRSLKRCCQSTHIIRLSGHGNAMG
jgi:hypothetical protein